VAKKHNKNNDTLANQMPSLKTRFKTALVYMWWVAYPTLAGEAPFLCGFRRSMVCSRREDISGEVVATATK
jgi:hypothetical protein